MDDSEIHRTLYWPSGNVTVLNRSPPEIAEEEIEEKTREILHDLREFGMDFLWSLGRAYLAYEILLAFGVSKSVSFITAVGAAATVCIEHSSRWMHRTRKKLNDKAKNVLHK